jgi:hypothetical protein
MVVGQFEQDPKKLPEIFSEIHWLLAEKQHRMEAKPPEQAQS